MTVKSKFQVGMATEYYVACYFTEQGYNVYWPLYSQSKDDFAIEKDGKFLKVQVKKATWSITGKYKYLQCRVGQDRRGFNEQRYHKYNESDFDLIAFLSDEKELWITDYDSIKSTTNVCLKSTNPNPNKVSKSKTYNADDWRVI